MKAEDFKALWKDIEGKAVNIDYGKSHWKNKVLVLYKESLGIVYIRGGSSIFIRSIKAIELIQPNESPAAVPVVELPAEECIVTPRLPDNWNENGFFVICGNLGGNWKHLEFRDKTGEVELKSLSSFKHSDLIDSMKELLQQLAKRKKPLPGYLIDDSFVAPVYFNIKKGFNEFFIEKIVN